ncbi:MAG: NADH-quinone oxidoreductase subunit C [Clostridiales Family XIII bacterium]|jgi:ech hydrogenase subunit D|nr:NADH-quinone oxidoreductase subunit C [Clostridiales Family XIII bacterium]
MTEALYRIQNFVPIQASELLNKVRDMKSDGQRLGQICCTKVEEGFEILYSFDKDHVLTNLRLTVPEDEAVQSVTGVYWPAFIYENEMQDLFGVKFKNMALNYEGRFFKVSEPTPWNPQK